MRKRAHIDQANKTVTLEGWITFDRSGLNRVTKGPPSSLDRGERRLKISLTVPLAIFTEPELSARIRVEGEPTMTADIDVVTAVQEAVLGVPGAVFEIVTPEERE